MPSPKPIEVFLGSHPAVLRFVQAPKSFPLSFATEAYFGVTAMFFSNAAEETRFGRYRIEPVTALSHLSDDEAESKDGDYLVKENVKRVAKDGVNFTVKAQKADAGDVIDDATIHWPADREVVTLG